MRLLPVTLFTIFLLCSSSTEALAPYDIGIDGKAKQKLWLLPFALNFMDYQNIVSSHSVMASRVMTRLS